MDNSSLCMAQQPFSGLKRSLQNRHEIFAGKDSHTSPDTSYVILDTSYGFLDTSYGFLDANYGFLDASYGFLDAS